MILTDPAGPVPEATQTLKDLQTQQVIIGGEAAVSAAVADSLTKATQDGGLGLVVARISGADRLSTAVALISTPAGTPRTPPSRSWPDQPRRDPHLTTVFLARSDTFPDSLTAAVQGLGSLFGVQPINGGFGLGADPNKLNYGCARRWDPSRPGTSCSPTIHSPRPHGVAAHTVGGGTNGLAR